MLLISKIILNLSSCPSFGRHLVLPVNTLATPQSLKSPMQVLGFGSQSSQRTGLTQVKEVIAGLFAKVCTRSLILATIPKIDRQTDPKNKTALNVLILRVCFNPLAHRFKPLSWRIVRPVIASKPSPFKAASF